ncbi:hypothetical protein [Arcobacter arenosus]|nr:hypothetical protein [Arcobacter arenosus]
MNYYSIQLNGNYITSKKDSSKMLISSIAVISVIVLVLSIF